MQQHLRAGVAVYNEGHYHAAHDAWEDRWLDLEDGTDDERLLHGLIQFTAAVHHATRENEDGATGLAESALEYIAALPNSYRKIDLDGVCEALRALEADPLSVAEYPPPIRYDGVALAADDLDIPEIGVAAEIVAEEFGHDTTLVEDAAEYAQTDIEAGQTSSPFVPLLFDIVGGDDQRRRVTFQRLSQHVERRRAREEDVSGLFD